MRRWDGEMDEEVGIVLGEVRCVGGFVVVFLWSCCCGVCGVVSSGVVGSGAVGRGVVGSSAVGSGVVGSGVVGNGVVDCGVVGCVVERVTSWCYLHVGVGTFTLKEAHIFRF